MEYTLEFNNATGICTFIVTGKVHSPKDSRELQYRVAQTSCERKYSLFLMDMRQAEMITGTAAAFETADPKEDYRYELQKHRTAVLYSKLTDHERFFETAAVNRGFRLKVFDKYDEAVEWLVEHGTSVRTA